MYGLFLLSFKCYGEDIPIIPDNPPPDNFPIKRLPMQLPAVDIEGECVTVELHAAAPNVSIVIYDSEGLPLFSSVSTESASTHRFNIPRLPAGHQYTLLLSVGSQAFTGSFSL